MKIFIYISFIFSISYATVMDDIHIFNAQKKYNEYFLQASFDEYLKIENKNSQVYYNMGNILYKQKKYTQAIEYYNKIENKKLRYKKLHNLGNCFAKLNQLDKAISYYKEALTIQKDQDTKRNLKLVQELKTKGEAQELKDDEIEKQLKSEKKIRDGQKKIDQYKDSNKSNNSNSSTSEKKEIFTSYNISKLKTQSKHEINQNYVQIEDKKNKIYVTKDAQISDIEESKWNKKLKNRKLKTLLIPIDKIKDKNVQLSKPW